MHSKKVSLPDNSRDGRGMTLSCNGTFRVIGPFGSRDSLVAGLFVMGTFLVTRRICDETFCLRDLFGTDFRISYCGASAMQYSAAVPHRGCHSWDIFVSRPLATAPFVAGPFRHGCHGTFMVTAPFGHWTFLSQDDLSRDFFGHRTFLSRDVFVTKPF